MASKPPPLSNFQPRFHYPEAKRPTTLSGKLKGLSKTQHKSQRWMAREIGMLVSEAERLEAIERRFFPAMILVASVVATTLLIAWAIT